MTGKSRHDTEKETGTKEYRAIFKSGIIKIAYYLYFRQAFCLDRNRPSLRTSDFSAKSRGFF
jgi:hypothetical protein